MRAPKTKALLQAVRAFAFPASLIPVLIAGALALSYPGQVAWRLYPLVIICSLLLHASTNVIAEYFDFKKGVDQKHTFGSSRVLVDGLLNPKEVLLEGYALLGLSFLLGLILVTVRGLPMLLIGLAGISGGYFYSAGPVGYKYLGLGDIMVFLLMGPLMVAGAYYALTGAFQARALYVSLPVGFLVAAILNANNLRDIPYDKAAKVKTLEMILGWRLAKRTYFLLIGSAYAGVLIMIVTAVLPAWSALVALSLPLAIRNIKTVGTSLPDNPQQIAAADVETAKLHLAFGTLLALSLLIARLRS
ncbi:MAG TPA: 1,4-dihydroxy-2-naphthoate octaprenyltransferase [Patescibacteria group bacterium]|nr:1,4-dihydroxy-2-naphthoate octaprenyltransferase [Patescibacteria group bacterium]